MVDLISSRWWTLLLNGLYLLELTATDVQGQQVSEQVAVSVEGRMKIGHFTLTTHQACERLRLATDAAHHACGRFLCVTDGAHHACERFP